MKKKIILILSFLILILSFILYPKVPNNSLYKASKWISNYQQESFEEYVMETKKWIEENRVFLTKDEKAELKANIPFEMLPEEWNSRKWVLLVHWLWDSPFIFRDLAKELTKQGFIVRVILLPWHWTRPADLTLPEYKNWEKIVSHQTKLFSKNLDELWLWGFSTWANLATNYAINDENIKGLLLFSPALKPKDKLHFLAPYAKIFIDWLDIDINEKNYTRYSNIAMNWASLFSKSVKKADSLLKNISYKKPTLMVISEYDSVVDSEKTLKLFNEKFTNSKNKLIWYGENKIDDNRIISLQSYLPEHKISNFSHMWILFSPENYYYWKNGLQLICDNGQSEKAEKECSTTENLWYSSFDYKEKDKIHARLTWNPYFQELTQTIKEITQ